MVKNLNRHFTKVDVEMAETHKKFSIITNHRNAG